MPSHDPVHFSIIEDYISTTYANKMTAGPTPRNGMKAAIIGAGPAGLTIAVLLARWGYDITIFDARDQIGGVMRYGIPNYRLPDSVLDDFAYRHLELKDIKVRTNTAIGQTITIDDLFRDGYKSVFIGAGLWKANAMHIKGETLGNVAFGIDYLANSRRSAWGRHCRHRRGQFRHGLRPHRHPQRCPPRYLLRPPGRGLHQRLRARSAVRQARGRGLPLLQGSGGDPGKRHHLPRHRQGRGRQVHPGGGQRGCSTPTPASSSR